MTQYKLVFFLFFYGKIIIVSFQTNYKQHAIQSSETNTNSDHQCSFIKINPIKGDNFLFEHNHYRNLMIIRKDCIEQHVWPLQSQQLSVFGICRTEHYKGISKHRTNNDKQLISSITVIYRTTCRYVYMLC